MLGKNKITKPKASFDGFYNVVNVFYTLQGEGIFAGHPAVFVRLQGCNLRCPFCDTNFDDGSTIGVEDLVSTVVNCAAGKTRLVVITGGEPMLQPIGELCQMFIDLGFGVQIETNGTVFRPLPEGVSIVCSPKADAAGRFFEIDQRLFENLAAIKFVVSATMDGYVNADPFIAQKAKAFGVPIYVQPMDELDDLTNRRNLQHATKMAMDNGYRLSIQIHKIANIE